MIATAEHTDKGKAGAELYGADPKAIAKTMDEQPKYFRFLASHKAANGNNYTIGDVTSPPLTREQYETLVAEGAELEEGPYTVATPEQHALSQARLDEQLVAKATGIGQIGPVNTEPVPMVAVPGMEPADPTGAPKEDPADANARAKAEKARQQEKLQHDRAEQEKHQKEQTEQQRREKEDHARR